MKIAFYVNNSQFPNIDCRNVVEANPGVGGTWHMVLLVASQLAVRNNNIDVTLYSQVKGLLPEGPKIDNVDTQEQAIYEADKNGFDFIILNYGGFDWAHFDFTRIKSNLRIIVWCHNFCSLSDLSRFSAETKIAKIIAVGREQMDLYRDHPAFKKTDYIYNCVPFPNDYKERAFQVPYGKRDKVVVYLASLVPAKSFHILADIWPYVLKCVPDAKLYVIGSGKTYFKDAKLGRFGIASHDYENIFMPKLTDEKGNILPSVKFYGNLGCEKYDIMCKAKVGVPNPTGSTETFCISAVEMQNMGCTVTAMKAPGYYDTFFNGIITKRSKKAFAQSVVKLLKSEDPIQSYSEAVDRIQNNFSIESVLKEWEELLITNVNGNYHLHKISPLVNKSYRLKWLKEIIRICHMAGKIPSVEALLLKMNTIHKLVYGY